MNRKPKLYGLFRLLLWICILLAFAAGTLWFLNNRITHQLAQAQEQSRVAQENLRAIENTSYYQKTSFVQNLYNESTDLPWSEHILALIDVLQSIQNLDNNETIELYDFTVNLNSIAISGKASNLALLYYPKSDAREWLLSAVSWLSFLDDIRIQTYIKEDSLYEFTLYATIILDETSQQ